MEESHNVYCKEDVARPERTKRKLKTPAQLKALEKLYNAHKYPSELMKVQFAKQIGLSEKQVSGWFCHRRLKDKKFPHGEVYENGKRSVSNGAIHDRASGLKQESCSSTKHGDIYFDSKEVESKSLYNQNCSAAVLTSEHSRHTRGGHCIVEDERSSGSSSAPQERFLQRDDELYELRPSRYSFWNNKGAKSRRHIMDPDNPYLEAGVENPSVTSLKRKLGRHYLDDGPALGVVFDPLPPGAYVSPIRESKNGPYYVGDSVKKNCFGMAEETKSNCSERTFHCEEGFRNKFVNSTSQSSGFLNRKGTMSPTRPIKNGKTHKVRRTLDYHSSVGQEVLMTSEKKMGRKATAVGFQSQNLVRSPKKFKSSYKV